ncbi:MAG: AraC family transcriptional regulator [Polyangiales bacterium]
MTGEDAMPFLIERGPELSATARVEGWPSIVLPLEHSVVELRLREGTHRLDRSSMAIVPAKQRHRLAGLSPVNQVLTLMIGDRARAWVIDDYAPHVEEGKLERVLSSPRVLARTRWFDEIAHRFLFERDVCEKVDSIAARFLATELTKEIYFLASEKLDDKTRASVVHVGSDVAQRARAYIEEHLFEPLHLDQLAKTLHTSESTLLRAFRREHGIAPATYHRDRRLDEALLMLESGRHSVGEVATHVGYGNLAAFTVAFRRRFRAVPSSVKARPAANVPPGGEAHRRERR